GPRTSTRSTVDRFGLMTILVDSAVWPWRGRLWAHLISDASLDELHAFAARLALPERSFGGDHYDITDELRDCAIAEGAQPVDSRAIVQALHAAGLRKRPAHRHQP
ncbi:MAG: DUF4031 domain-containing protein, partial [Actinomycetota bacterium]|nr:DUF4031 domain-containing protein [Actinomycetota bacterium]